MAYADSMTPRTRFAPSPTGYLHIGHAYAALAVEAEAQRLGAAVTLRIEDTDATRCRPEFTAAIIEDLRWLGLAWDDQVVQSQRLAHYAAAIDRLAADGLAYRCFCSRRQIAEAATAHGPEGPLYPGTCRQLEPDEAAARAHGTPHGWRFDHRAASDRYGDLHWRDSKGAEHRVMAEHLDDVLLASRDRPASYHLAVVVDDSEGGISHVVRGRDLLLATAVQRLLQAALDLPVPVYHHHALLVEENGRKLAKSDQSLTLRSLRQAGVTPPALRADLANGRFPAGMLLQTS